MERHFAIMAITHGPNKHYADTHRGSHTAKITVDCLGIVKGNTTSDTKGNQVAVIPKADVLRDKGSRRRARDMEAVKGERRR